MLAALHLAAKQGVLGAAHSQIKLYPNAGHAFHADYRASFNKEAAEDGWRLALNWFSKNGLL